MASAPPLTLKELSELPAPPDGLVLTSTGGFGLAHTKTEGVAIPYDPGAGPPGPPLTRWQRLQLRLDALARRLRWMPARLYWAVFGDEYW